MNTKVKVYLTDIKAVDETTDKVTNIIASGRLNKTEAKAYAKDNGFTFVSKQSITKEFEVNTNALLALEITEQ